MWQKEGKVWGGGGHQARPHWGPGECREDTARSKKPTAAGLRWEMGCQAGPGLAWGVLLLPPSRAESAAEWRLATARAAVGTFLPSGLERSFMWRLVCKPGRDPGSDRSLWPQMVASGLCPVSRISPSGLPEVA